MDASLQPKEGLTLRSVYSDCKMKDLKIQSTARIPLPRFRASDILLADNVDNFATTLPKWYHAKWFVQHKTAVL